MILRSLLIVATPYMFCVLCICIVLTYCIYVILPSISSMALHSSHGLYICVHVLCVCMVYMYCVYVLCKCHFAEHLQHGATFVGVILIYMCITRVNASCHTCEWDVAHERMRHVTHVHESCHTCGWVIPPVWMSDIMWMMRHVTHVNALRHTYERFMSHTWMSHVTHVNASWQTYEQVMSHIWMRHVTR